MLQEVASSHASSVSADITDLMKENKTWKTFILDLRKKECFQFILERLIKLAKEGYDGFFLDTLDSYQTALPEKEWTSYENAEVEIIKELRRRFPNKIIVVNRAFRIFDSIKKDINGFLVESLFFGLDEKLNYVKMPESHTKHMLKLLKKVQSAKVPVIVVDYLPPQKREALSAGVFSLPPGDLSQRQTDKLDALFHL